MKRILLGLLLSAALVGCAAQADRGQEAPASTASAAGEGLFFRVETVQHSDSEKAEDGTVLAECDYELPEMTVCRADGSAPEAADSDMARSALDRAAAFNESFATWKDEAEFAQVAEMARQDREMCREMQLDWTGPYMLGLSCSVYQTEQLVSVAGTYFGFTGGSHPNTYLMGWNFDLDTGEFFNVRALSDGTALEEYVTEELNRQVRTRAAEAELAPSELYWEDYELILADWSSYAVSFDESGMTVAFSPFELAAYAAGAQTFTIPYESLAPHLNPRGLQVLGLEE